MHDLGRASSDKTSEDANHVQGHRKQSSFRLPPTRMFCREPFMSYPHIASEMTAALTAPHTRRSLAVLGVCKTAGRRLFFLLWLSAVAVASAQTTAPKNPPLGIWSASGPQTRQAYMARRLKSHELPDDALEAIRRSSNSAPAG